jgi:formylglycine-generating enzyme required for sulfatase activity
MLFRKFILLCCIGLTTSVLANNIAVSNVSLTGQNTTAGTNSISNFAFVQFNLSWDNSWRYNSNSGSISYLGAKSPGTGYNSAPNIFIGSQGALPWVASTPFTVGQLLVVYATPNRYYITTASDTTQANAPTHITGTVNNLQFVSVNDAGGSGATAIANLAGTSITSYTLTSTGSGYTSIPSVIIAPTNGGSGATADTYISSWWDAAWVFVKYRVGSSDPTFTNVSLTANTNTVTLPNVNNLRVGMPVYKSSGSTTVASGMVITAINPNTNEVTLSGNFTGTSAINNTLVFRRIWEHSSLGINGHNAANGSTIDVPADGKGAFIYRNSHGSGNNTFNNTQLRWNYGADGILDNAIIQVQVFAIEMVYVPTGSFWLGPGGESGFYVSNTPSTPYNINSEDSILVGTSVGNMRWHSSSQPVFTIPNSFPKGFNAFYCMKYELSQGAYRDFLNTLTYQQQFFRMERWCPNYMNGACLYSPASPAGTEALGPNSNQFGNTIAIQIPGNSTDHTPAVFGCNYNQNGTFNEIDDGEWFACNLLTWVHMCAYLDWAALRPMTELEYEKACRGPNFPIAGEYAWGNLNVFYASSRTNAGRPDESPNNNSNVHGNSGSGAWRVPLRVGSFARPGATRQDAGASYWGIMEMTGNLMERTVTIGHIIGRNFTGIQGDGTLSINGHANVNLWPGFVNNEVTAANYISRGGRFITLMSVRSRGSTATTATYQSGYIAWGARGVRNP